MSAILSVLATVRHLSSNVRHDIGYERKSLYFPLNTQKELLTPPHTVFGLAQLNSCYSTVKQNKPSSVPYLILEGQILCPTVPLLLTWKNCLLQKGSTLTCPGGDWWSSDLCNLQLLLSQRLTWWHRKRSPLWFQPELEVMRRRKLRLVRTLEER